MKATRIIILALALLVGLGKAMAQEDCNRAQKAPQAKETVLTKSTRTKKGYDNYQAAYKAALREAKQAHPNKEVGIRNLSKGDVKVNGDGSVSNYYNYTVVELPGIVAQTSSTPSAKPRARLTKATASPWTNLPSWTAKPTRRKPKAKSWITFWAKAIKWWPRSIWKSFTKSSKANKAASTTPRPPLRATTSRRWATSSAPASPRNTSKCKSSTSARESLRGMLR